VTLISGKINTNYTCDNSCYESECSECIIRIDLSKSFGIIGGILKLGISSRIFSSSSSLLLLGRSTSSFHFIDVEDNGYLSLNYMRIIFVGEMRSMILVRGGSVCMKCMKIIDERWIGPLIEIFEANSTINIEIYKMSIKKSYYECTNIKSGSNEYKSSIIFIENMSREIINLNISNCLFQENIINLFYNESGNGNICCFSSLKSSSLFNIYIDIYFIFLFY
jgi:hypothetical protein